MPYVLPADELHIWQSRIDWSPACIGELAHLLSPEERRRVERFQHDADRRRLVVGRGLLRLILAHLLRTRPDVIEFAHNEYHKPSLAIEPHTSGLQFNVSHSADLVLLAFATGRAVGVDVEKLRTGSAIDGIAASHFSLREREDLATVSSDLKLEAFFACWTRKEAFIKARGLGLSMPLDQFDVSLLPGQPAELRATRPDPAERTRWAVTDLEIEPGYKAAVAIEGSGRPIKRWLWPSDCLSLQDVFSRPLAPPPA
jgi:4'-phosphopantetheinyl transferase